MDRVQEKVSDRRVLALIESFLKQGHHGWSGQELDAGRRDPARRGDLPLLANIYLNPLGPPDGEQRALRWCVMPTTS